VYTAESFNLFVYFIMRNLKFFNMYKQTVFA